MKLPPALYTTCVVCSRTCSFTGLDSDRHIRAWNEHLHGAIADCPLTIEQFDEMRSLWMQAEAEAAEEQPCGPGGWPIRPVWTGKPT